MIKGILHILVLAKNKELLKKYTQKQDAQKKVGRGQTYQRHQHL